jgi:hypothetical protein
LRGDGIRVDEREATKLFRGTGTEFVEETQTIGKRVVEGEAK